MGTFWETPIKKWKQLHKKVSHGPVAKNWKQLSAVGLVILGLGYMYVGYECDPTKSLAHNIWATIDPIAGIGAFIFTLIVLYNQGMDRYLNSLEKRLSVDYYLLSNNDDPKLIMKIEQAYLAGDADIRQWAQSLGGQQLTGDHLSFDMHFETVFERKKERDKNGTPFLHYKINMYLDKDPRQRVKLVEDKNDPESQESKLLTEETYKFSILLRPAKDKIWTWKRKSE